MTVTDAEFERELESFRVDAESAAQFFYAFQAIHYLSSSDSGVLALMNQAPMYWNTSNVALREAMFVALGRVFDPDPQTHNVSRLLKLARDNPALFSKDALAARKQGDGERPGWLDEYLEGAHVPDADDWRRLRRYVAAWRRVYDAGYRGIRHQVVAHRAPLTQQQLDELFGQTSYRELEKLFAFLDSFYRALWQLYFNGRRPVLRHRRRSLIQMFATADQPGALGRTAGEMVARDTRRFFETHAACRSGQQGHWAQGQQAG